MKFSYLKGPVARRMRLSSLFGHKLDMGSAVSLLPYLSKRWIDLCDALTILFGARGRARASAVMSDVVGMVSWASHSLGCLL